MAQIFTGGRSVFFLNFFTQIRYANLYFSREGNSKTGSLGTFCCRKNVVARVAQAERAWWTIGHVSVTSSSPLSRASSNRAPLDRVRRWCEKRHGAGLLLLRRVSGVKMWCVKFKDSLLQAQTATPRAMWHPHPRGEAVLCKNAYCPLWSWQILPLASP